MKTRYIRTNFYWFQWGRDSKNEMFWHSFGVAAIFVSLLHFIAPALDLTAQLADGGSRDYNKGIKFKKGAVNCCIET